MVGNSEHKGKKASTPVKKKYILRSSDRVLRSRSQEKTKQLESNGNPRNINSSAERKGRKKKKKNVNGSAGDEYSKVRKHLGYLLNRIKYEQSLITAYSLEGWKGLSAEKLKPEKELQRANSEILKRKLKIRDLFKQMDSLCQEGKIPADLFDSAGEIDSEDIFCAKCGSKDVTANNDIILCDGVCDRGFHQLCLVPPLLKQDIPSDDEGWLCPGCDCKDDCIGLLNDFQGSTLCIEDDWEKVFPEAAAASANGQQLDHNFRLSSSDDDDDDYDPDGPKVDEKSRSNEMSSDKANLGHEQHLGLPSDDSEDDDFDPDAPDIDEKKERESSGSDFTSDSEDLTAVLEKDSGEVESPSLGGLQRHSHRQTSKWDSHKKQSLDGELLSLTEQGPDKEKLEAISGKRNVERLDYKKLYDISIVSRTSTDNMRLKETFGNVSSDSDDDDEDYNTGNDPLTPINNGDTKDLMESERTSRRRARKKSDAENTAEPITKHEDSHPCGSSFRSAKSAQSKFGDAITKRLRESFGENQYPDHSTKESLAKELGLTFQQVNRWFVNTRWSFNHSSSAREDVANSTPKASPVANSNKLSNGLSENVNITDTCSKAQSEETHKLNNQKNSKQTSTLPKPSGRKRQHDEQILDPSSTVDEKSEKTDNGFGETQSIRRSTRLRKTIS